MIELLGDRQRQLLRHLLADKAGLTVEELSTRLEIARNAVRQHLAALTGAGLVTSSGTRPSGGRPEQLYVLTEKGKEGFPRQYAWFAQLVMESLHREPKILSVGDRLAAIGRAVGGHLKGQHPGLETREDKVARLTEVMDQLGYEAKRATRPEDDSTIEADNCVFHRLALQNPDVCRLDLELLATFTDSQVEHQECMAKGGNVCRFKFSPKAS